MEKRGIIFTLFLFLVLSLLLIAGIVYLKIRFFDGFQFKTGNVVVKLDYENEEKQENNLTEISNENSDNRTFSIEEINESSSYINITTD